MASARLRWIGPAAITLAVCSLYLLLRLARVHGDPLALADPGTKYGAGVVGGTEGYDGQFALYVALDPDPKRVAPRLDAPAYRYQRILYPLLARGLAAGNPDAIPWTLVFVNLAAHAVGTLLVCALLDSYGQPLRYGLAYGLWVGLVAAVGLDLHEPLAFMLVAAAWWARRNDRPTLGAAWIGLALFAKETSLIFWAGWILADVLVRGTRRNALALALVGLPFLLWQVWLWREFGAPAIASGGAMATPFELLPFRGLWRIGEVDLRVLGLYLLIFGPTLIVPSLWGVFSAVGRLRAGDRSPEAVTLLLHGAGIAFLPFSTFREPLGLLRIATGLVLSIVVFAGRYGLRRPLNYSLFWTGLLAVLFRG